jgi:hypothetical protein
MNITTFGYQLKAKNGQNNKLYLKIGKVVWRKNDIFATFFKLMCSTTSGAAGMKQCIQSSKGSWDQGYSWIVASASY